jgi:hypothetical protein
MISKAELLIVFERFLMLQSLAVIANTSIWRTIRILYCTYLGKTLSIVEIAFRNVLRQSSTSTHYDVWIFSIWPFTASYLVSDAESSIAER